MQTVIGSCRKQGRSIPDTLEACLLAYAHGDRPYPTLIPADLETAKT